ncbi:hypothetical protein [Sphingobium bisphenolivorans]|uniref:hypothetical protein n=1 Tax=Sphingobium bisphenolivorans TaxID=1335760 RepID=UPI000399FF32|nr:hypothetical protein [Sphingobium bisphenolivorans]
MNARIFDWIWHIRGSVAIAPEQPTDDVLGRLDPLFRQDGTSHSRTGDRLTFSKKDPAAQDKMSIFDRGVLQVEKGASGSILRYHLTSKALLFCFLAPFFFLAVAQLTVAIGKLEKPSTEAVEKKPHKEPALLPQNPIDKALGAPAPEKPDKKKAEEQDKKPSPTPAYVFAALFAILYVAGRLLEDKLVKSLFRKSVLSAQ